MKKLIIPVLAIVLAFSSSAFTTKKVVRLVQPSLFWYSLNGSGQLQAQLNSTAQTKDDSMPAGANPITDCEDQTSEHCIVGYTSTQSTGIPAPAVAGDDYRINTNN